MLSVRSLHVAIDSVVALRGLSLEVRDGRMVGLVGRNGAGKTTLMRSLMGHLAPGGGSVEFDGRDLLALPPHARAGLGIGYMPEDRGLVPELTVEENILVPLWVNRGLGVWPYQRLSWRRQLFCNRRGVHPLGGICLRTYVEIDGEILERSGGLDRLTYGLLALQILLGFGVGWVSMKLGVRHFKRAEF